MVGFENLQDERMEESAVLLERQQLALERLASVVTEETVPQPFCAYFQKTAAFVLWM